MMSRRLLICILFVVSCGDEPSGLYPTRKGNGPKVIFDLGAKPLPEIPFPNNVATYIDPKSPTGLRINLSKIAPTNLESEIRIKANALDGFGTFAPITVRFDAPLHLQSLKDRHAGNRDFSDDAVFVIDVTKESPDFGKPVMLDFDRGFFPIVMRYSDQYFPYDPRASGGNLMFETVSEKEGEDTDGDGILDKPNTLPENGDPYNDLLTFYERETNTLILQPVVPLRERTTYAVVITRRVLGENGTGDVCEKDEDCKETSSCDLSQRRCREPVQSPFRAVNDANQTPALLPLKEILPNEPYKISIEDIAFAWVFTTQSITLPMKTIREGLYGYGPMKRLAKEFPATYKPMVLKTPEKAKETGGASIIWTWEVMQVAKPILGLLEGVIPSLSGPSVDALIESYNYVDFIFAGTFRSPNFMVDRDGWATEKYPADDDESFDVDPVSGDATYGETEVPFTCVVPKERVDLGIKKPFPVAIFMHGTASNKLMGLGYAGQFARMGIATCAIDGFAHGLPFPSIAEEGSFITEETIRELIATFAPGYEPIYDFMKGNRVRDLNNDGNLDPAGDFWTYDAFHTRDAVRQTVIDLVTLTRILRAFDGNNKTNGADGNPEIMGDFDHDGRVDIGGPNNRYFAWGISLGGIVTGVFAGLEPALDSASIVVGGGGLSHIAIRSSQPGVPEMAILPMLGPILAFELDKDGWVVSFVVPNMATLDHVEVARIKEIPDFGKVVITNLRTLARRELKKPKGSGFSIGIQADALRPTEIRAIFGFDPAYKSEKKPCIDDNCTAPLKCVAGQCGCEEDKDCPNGQRCDSVSHRCLFKPAPVDTPLANEKHPALGDPIKIEVFNENGKLIETIDRFGKDVEYNGIIYPKDAPLVALYRGFGYIRQSPEFRRMVGIAQTILDPADPVNWARHYGIEPLDYSQTDPNVVMGARVLVLPSIGDPVVPISTGIAIARAAGILGYEKPDGRYGDKTQMEVLVEKYVVEGISNTKRFTIAVKDKNGKSNNYSIMYDPDDLDGSRFYKDCNECEWLYNSKGGKVVWQCKDPQGNICGDGFGAPFDLIEPLRATVVLENKTSMPATCMSREKDNSCRVWKDERGIHAIRFTMTEPWGYHGLLLMAPYKAFDIETYIYNMIGRFFMTSGQELWDDKCLMDSSCEWMPSKIDMVR